MISAENRPNKENAKAISEAYSDALVHLGRARESFQKIEELLNSGEIEAMAEHFSTSDFQKTISLIEEKISSSPENWRNASAIRKA